tara:strand:- start:884 stop:1162 length:279 start_codon:yes stop_codon:yes gene_type:complete
MKTKIPIETLFARRKTRISEKIEKAAEDLHDAILQLADIQDEFSLSEPSIEYIDEWSSDAIQSIDTIEHMISDLESFLFDGDTVILSDEVED